MNDCHEHAEFLKFRGFEPDSCLRGLVSTAMDRILGFAPSDASPAGFLHRTSEGFEGTLSLISQQGVFAAKVLASTPAEAVLRMNERVFEQIRKWQSSRVIIPD